MKLVNKAFWTIGSLLASFIIVAYVAAMHLTLLAYLVITIACSVVILWTVRAFVADKEDQIKSGSLFLKQSAPTVAEEPEIELNVKEMIKKIQQSDSLLKTTEVRVNDSELTIVETELNKEKDPLARFAHYDSLVAMPNRVLFNEILNKSINHAKRHNKILAILIVDAEPLVHFSPDLTQDIGEDAIKELGTRFVNILRTEDIIAKLDGNEFIILLNDIRKSKFASTVAEKLLQVMTPPIDVGYNKLSLKGNIGICVFPNDGQSLEGLIQKAYSALYKSKNLSGSAYQFYTPEIDIEAKEYIRVEKDLRRAIQNNELTLYYQPQLNIKSGNVCGVEALIRWMHPEHGIIYPAKFMEIAEDTGLISQIGEWAIREACRTNKYWQDEGYEHLTVSINLSPRQFNNPNIATVISNILHETNLDPNYLELEINEKTVMDDIDDTAERLNKIKETGVRLCIDHFGIGYTSISQLKKLPVSSIKIDRDYIRGVPNNPDDSAVASAIIALVHNLGLEVIAEGVETAEQVQYLAVQNCDIVQGYFLSYPLPAHKVVQQFKKLMDKVIV